MVHENTKLHQRVSVIRHNGMNVPPTRNTMTKQIKVVITE